MEQVKIVKCPTCGDQVRWEMESVFRPFCSKRCKLIDLGAWADSEYSIAAVESDQWQNPDSNN